MYRFLPALICTLVIHGCAGSSKLTRNDSRELCNKETQSIEQCLETIDEGLSEYSVQELIQVLRTLNEREASSTQTSEWLRFLGDQNPPEPALEQRQAHNQWNPVPLWIEPGIPDTDRAIDRAPPFPTLPEQITRARFSHWIARVLNRPVCHNSEKGTAACFGNTPILFSLSEFPHNKPTDLSGIRVLRSVEQKLIENTPWLALPILSKWLHETRDVPWQLQIHDWQTSINTLLGTVPEPTLHTPPIPLIEALPNPLRKDGGIRELALQQWIHRIEKEPLSWIKAGIIALLVKQVQHSWELQRVQPLCNTYLSLRQDILLNANPQSFDATTIHQIQHDIQLGLLCADNDQLQSLFDRTLVNASKQSPAWQLSVLTSLLHNWMQVPRPPHQYTRFTRGLARALGTDFNVSEKHTFAIVTEGLSFLLEGSTEDRSAVFDAIRWMEKRLRSSAPVNDPLKETRPAIRFLLQVFLASLQSKDGQNFAAHQTLEKAMSGRHEVIHSVASLLQEPTEKYVNSVEAIHAVMQAWIDPSQEQILGARTMTEKTCPETTGERQSLCLPLMSAVDSLFREELPDAPEPPFWYPFLSGMEEKNSEQELWEAIRLALQYAQLKHPELFPATSPDFAQRQIEKWKNTREKVKKQGTIAPEADPALNTVWSIADTQPNSLKKPTNLTDINDWTVSCSGGNPSQIPLVSQTITFSVVEWVLEGKDAWNLSWFNVPYGQPQNPHWQCQVTPGSQLGWTLDIAIRKAVENEAESTKFHAALIQVIELGALILTEASANHRPLTRRLVQELRNRVNPYDFAWLSILARTQGHLHSGQELEELYREIVRQQNQQGISSKSIDRVPSWVSEEIRVLRPVVEAWYGQSDPTTKSELLEVIETLNSVNQRYTLTSVLHATTGDLKEALDAIYQIDAKLRQQDILLSLWESVAVMVNDSSTPAVTSIEELLENPQLKAYPGEVAGTTLLLANLFARKGDQEGARITLEKGYNTVSASSASLHEASLLQLLLPSPDFSPDPKRLRERLKHIIINSKHRLALRELVQLRILLIKSLLLNQEEAAVLPHLTGIVLDMQASLKAPPFLWTFRAVVTGMLLVSGDAKEKDLHALQEKIPDIEALAPTRNYIKSLMETDSDEKRQVLTTEYLNELFGIEKIETP